MCLGASGAFAASQAALAGQVWLAPDGASLSPIQPVADTEPRALRAGRGLSVFRLKGACLWTCRLRLTVFLERGRPGPAGAFRVGLDLGIVCHGGCRPLMALACVGAMASLVWMGLATTRMVMENLREIGRDVTRPLGWALRTAAFALAVQGALA